VAVTLALDAEVVEGLAAGGVAIGADPALVIVVVAARAVAATHGARLDALALAIAVATDEDRGDERCRSDQRQDQRGEHRGAGPGTDVERGRHGAQFSAAVDGRQPEDSGCEDRAARE